MDRSCRTPPFENGPSASVAPADANLMEQLHMWTSRAQKIEDERTALLHKRNNIDRLRAEIQRRHADSASKNDHFQTSKVMLRELEAQRTAQQSQLKARRIQVQHDAAAEQVEAMEFVSFRTRMDEAEHKAQVSADKEAECMLRQMDAIELVLGEKRLECSRLREELRVIASEREAAEGVAARIANFKDNNRKEQIRQDGLRERLCRAAAEVESAQAMEAELRDKITVIVRQRSLQDAEAADHSAFLRDLSEVLDSATMAADKVKSVNDMKRNLSVVLAALTFECDKEEDTNLPTQSTAAVSMEKEDESIMMCVPIQRPKRNRSVLGNITNAGATTNN
jgi:hypothetical protein